MTPYATNHTITTTRTGKQLRQQFKASVVYQGRADVVTYHADQKTVTPFRTPYFATREDAAEALVNGLDVQLSGVR